VLRFPGPGFSFDERVVRDNDQFFAYLEIGIGAHVAVRSGTLRVEKALDLAADALADNESDNCPICAIDEHVIDYAEQSSTLRDHFVTNDVGHARQVFQLGHPFFHPGSAHRYCVRPDGVQSGGRNHAPASTGPHNGFATHHDETSNPLAILLHNNFLDLAESFRRFHVDDGAPD
jgi:hypothetical protein